MVDIKTIFEKEKKRKEKFVFVLVVLLIVSAIFALSVGSVYISISDVLHAIGHSIFPNYISAPVNEIAIPIINTIRSPRILLAIVAGISLGYAGTVMQSTLRNPLVSPFTLGLSSAAAFGAAMTIVAGPLIFGSLYYGTVKFAGQIFYNSALIMIVFAFACGLLSIYLVCLISSRQKASQSVIILAGVVIGYLFQAGITFLKYVSDDSALREVTLWLMGGMWGASWASVLMLIPVVVICFYLIERNAKSFNAMMNGDDVAKNLGIDVEKLRRNSLIIVTIAVSACMAFTGVIGFIGLMAPHICRMFIGNDQKYLIIASALLGAVILLISDTVARVIMNPMELPVGVIMYVIGGIFFVYLISARNGRQIE